VRPISEWLAGDDVHDDAPFDRKIEASRQRGKTCVGLDLELMAGEDDAVKAQAGHAGEHSRPRPVFDREAHAASLAAQARQIRESFG
jgi:hypothetical protein